MKQTVDSTQLVRVEGKITHIKIRGETVCDSACSTIWYHTGTAMMMDFLSLYCDGLLNVMGTLNDGNHIYLTKFILFDTSLVSFANGMAICGNYGNKHS